MAYLVFIIFAVHVLNYVLTRNMGMAYQWLLWDYTLITSAFLNSILFYMALPHKRRKLKIAAVMIVILNAWFFTDYTIIWFLDENAYSESFRYIFTIALFGFFTAFGISAICKVFNNKSEKYNPKSSFIVHRAPKDFFGLIGSIFQNPEGLTFVVVKGQEYRFSRGKVVCRKHNTSGHYTYKCVRDINDIELGKIKSLKWSLLWNNCFTVFKRYDRKPRSA